MISLYSYMSNSLCKYKDAFGRLGTGIHSYRIMNIAVLDFGVTAAVAYLLSLIFKTRFLHTFIVFFLFGIIVHRAFCVRTTIDKLVFPNV
jgi:hypothetical protein